MWALILPLLPFAFSLTASPGPNNVLAMALATNFGYWRTVPVILGFVTGMFTLIMSVGLGLGHLFGEYPVIREMLKAVAVVYLLYLAWKIAHSGGVEREGTTTEPMTFLQGMLFQWVNPKAWIVSISAVATFSNPELGSVLRTVIIAFVFAIVVFPSVSLWALFGSAIARFLKSPKVLRFFNYAIAGLLVLSLVPLIFGEL
ncbi:MAG: LysE family translocator [Sneathiella sp.]